jgi:hypothetical protein
MMSLTLTPKKADIFIPFITFRWRVAKRRHGSGMPGAFQSRGVTEP